MKTIFNSGGIEALQRTAEIANKVSEYIKKIGFNEIRKKMPEVLADSSDEEKQTAIAEQGFKNLLEIVNKCLVDFPEETLEILGLMTYKTLDEMKDESTALFPLIYDLFQDPAVIRFLSSFLK